MLLSSAWTACYTLLAISEAVSPIPSTAFVSSNMNLLSWIGTEFGQLMEASTCEMRVVASVLQPARAYTFLVRAIVRL